MAESDKAPPEDADIVLEAHGLTKVFRDFWGRPKARAVNGIDFTVLRGQVFGLLGPNGSGKSTTVKMLLGLLYPTRGTLSVLGQSPQHVNTKRRIGYLPEESYLYRYLTAAESLDFFGALFGIPADERRRRCDQLLEMVGLASARNRPVGEFSKGMARRIGLAQALINDPELVILDEPTSGLDPLGCREVKDVIRLLARRGKTIVLCSHLLADVEDVCDQVLVLYGGRVCAHGGLTDMLKIEDRTRIVMPHLDPEQLEQVLAVVRQQVTDEGVKVDHPTMDLEQFFLNVVRKARDAAMETAGAKAGGEIAAYLRGNELPADPDERREALLAALSSEQPGPRNPEPKDAVPQPQTTRQTADAVQSKLSALTDAAPLTKTPPQPAQEDPKQPPSSATNEANERLRKMFD